MAPPKQPAAGMRSIASFFAPKAKAPPEQLPGIANGAIAPDPSESSQSPPPTRTARRAPPSPPRRPRAPRPARRPRAAGTGTLRRRRPPPPSPTTSSTRGSIQPCRRPSPLRATPPATATTANAAGRRDVGRRIAVLWNDLRGRYFAGNVAAYDAVNGKHHVRYDDGDDEWIAEIAARRQVGRRRRGGGRSPPWTTTTMTTTTTTTTTGR